MWYRLVSHFFGLPCHVPGLAGLLSFSVLVSGEWNLCRLSLYAGGSSSGSSLAGVNILVSYSCCVLIPTSKAFSYIQQSVGQCSFNSKLNDSAMNAILAPGFSFSFALGYIFKTFFQCKISMCLERKKGSVHFLNSDCQWPSLKVGSMSD